MKHILLRKNMIIVEDPASGGKFRNSKLIHSLQINKVKYI